MCPVFRIFPTVPELHLKLLTVCGPVFRIFLAVPELHLKLLAVCVSCMLYLHPSDSPRALLA